MDEGRFHDLLGRYHDGDASPAETAELESMLRADPRCRRILVERDLMEVQLRKSYAGAMVSAPKSARRRRSAPADGAPWTGPAVAAAALFAALLLFASMSSSPRSRRTESAPPAVPLPEQASAPPPVLPKKEPERPFVPPRPVERPVPPAPVEEPPKPPPPPPVPAAPTPIEPSRVETRTAVATVESVEGDPGTKLAAGQAILSGQGLATRSGVLKLRFPDGTLLVLEGATEIASIVGKRLSIQRGTVQAEVTKQPAGQPLLFATPHGEAKVLGTVLKILVDEASTRLEVREGRVQLKRLADGWTVDVVTGHFAMVAPGAEFTSRPLPISEIFLTTSHGQISGDEWRRVKDPKAAGGVLLEAASTANFAVMTMPIDHAKITAWFARQRSRSWVTFAFTADADTDYWVWVRGRCISTAEGGARLRADDVILEVGDAAFVRRPADWKPLADHLSPFNGYGAQQGFWWSGGSHDPGNTQTPIALRFKRSGRQVIRMHAMETPLQIDAIWLSTTRTTRPGPEEVPGKR